MSFFGPDDDDVIRLEKLDRTLHPNGWEGPSPPFDPDIASSKELEAIDAMLCQDEPPEEIPPEILEQLDEENSFFGRSGQPAPRRFFNRPADPPKTINLPETGPGIGNSFQTQLPKQNSFIAAEAPQASPLIVPNQTIPSNTPEKNIISGTNNTTPLLNNNIQPPQATNSGCTLPLNQQEPKRDNTPTPYSVAQSLLLSEKILVCSNAVLRYNGKYYQPYTSEDMKRFITGNCREAVELAGNANFVEQIYKCLTIEPNIYVDGPLQPSPDLIVFMDGVLNIQTDVFSPHSPEIFATSMLQAEYYQGLYEWHPEFDKFISRITGGDPARIKQIYEVLGCIFTQDLRGKNIFIFQGPPDSGKSVLGNFVRTCCPPSCVCSLDLHSFGKNFALGSLIGKRLCIDLDLSSGAISPISTSILKKLTGGDLLSADIKYMPRISFINSAQLLFATNHAIYTREPDPAFERRCVIVPFTQSIPRAEQDPMLLQKLEHERDGIIMTALQHYKEYRKNGYTFSESYPSNSMLQGGNGSLEDKILQFLRLSCHEEEGNWISTQELFAAFAEQFGTICKPKTFSSLIGPMIRNVYSDVKCNERGRISGNKNPIYGYSGMNLNNSKGG